MPALSSKAAARGELPIIEACLDLIRWYIPLLNRLPRQHKFGLGDRLVANLYHLMEQLVHARYAPTKLPILEPLKAHIVVIQMQTRLLHDFKLMEFSRYEHASRLMTANAGQQRTPGSPSVSAAAGTASLHLYAWHLPAVRNS